MKTAVIYFSYEGNCRLIAEQIQEIAHAELLDLHLQEEKQRKGLAKYVWGGRQVMLNQKPSLKPYTFDSASYELIIIGTPVWAGSPAPALDTFLEQTRIIGKQVALFCCCAGGKGKVFDKLKRSLADNTVVGEQVFINPLKQERKLVHEQVQKWLKSLDPAIAQRGT
ncbi:MAG: NAD(P)H-dependent oxidoreductase [Treponema sp.]|nr:NAD(P)H-dependent oxidoreductase [Treponema sp.]